MRVVNRNTKRTYFMTNNLLKQVNIKLTHVLSNKRMTNTVK